MINKVILMGRLTENPELKMTPSGVSVTTFNLAVQRNYVDKNSGERSADFPTIVAWRNTAEYICRYFNKGKLIAITGSLQTRTYTAKDGSKRYATEIVAEEAYFAGDNQQSNNNNAQKQQKASNAPSQAQPTQQTQTVNQEQVQQQAPNQDFEDMPLLNDDDLPF